VYLRETWGPLPAFLYGWALLLVIATGAIAAVAVTFANYALALTGLPDRLTTPVAVAAIVLLSAVNYMGVRPGALTQNIFTVLKLGALAALILAGLVLSPAPSAFAAPTPTAPAGSAAVMVSVGAALVPILFTYGGWQQTNFIAEEMIQPERNLPRALVAGVTIVVVVYLLANVVYLRVLGLPALARSSAPAADAMRAVLGPAGGRLIAAGIAASTFGFLNLVILVTPRVIQAMAADGAFLPRLAVLHPVHRTPAAALLLQAAWAIVLTVSGSFSQLVDYVAFGDWIFFGLTVAGLYVYRARDRAGGVLPAPGAFRVPGYPWTPGLFVAAALYVVGSSIAANPTNALIGTGLLGLGVPVYVFWKRRSMRVVTG
jgi:APA family basic amino acid/polyamine antiporter